jgi:hypothetical protein
MRPRPLPFRAVPVRAVLVLVLTFLAAGCGPGDELRLGDLDEGERRYVDRVVVLERAKAVALVDRPRGAALLDSLAAAWGDSSLAETEAGVPRDPARAAALGRLLQRILVAELDSLVHAPRPDRLAAPLPDPEPVAEPPAGD